MTRNLRTANTVVKLILAVSVIVFYFTHVISGPLAEVLMVFGFLIIGASVIKALLSVLIKD